MDESQPDETYVRPVQERRLADNGELFHVSMHLVTATGVARPGCVEFFDHQYRFPGTFLRGELCDLEPRIVGEGEWMKQMEQVFGQPFSEIFPIRWKLSVPHATGQRSGQGVIEFNAGRGCELKEDDV